MIGSRRQGMQRALSGIRAERTSRRPGCSRQRVTAGGRAPIVPLLWGGFGPRARYSIWAEQDRCNLSRAAITIKPAQCDKLDPARRGCVLAHPSYARGKGR